MIQSARTSFRAALLAGLGFVLALFGLSAYAGDSFKSVAYGMLSIASGDQRTLATADSCTLDTKTQEEEVFFISCGGIF